ncbi:CidA/LrgA family protein [Gallaecimonas mangrovi]|uniref:CidA/LrgA family protein n=1 Tax=Gallaecimonas mangrovi TaxID=2291597 RepID=UPI000E20AAD3|nr:CidA/LrgA family protein [Gallaecimonas mangrovi]
MMKLVRALAIIFACLYLGKGLCALTHLPIPGSIIGMLILFTLLSSKRLPAQWVVPAATPLIRHMTLLFIPAGVGLMNYLDVLEHHALVLVGSCIVSTCFIILAVGTLYQKRGPKGHD